MGLFIVGLFIGAIVGMVIMGLCAASGRKEVRQTGAIRSRHDKVRAYIQESTWHIIPTVAICNDLYWVGDAYWRKERSLILGWLRFRVKIILRAKKGR